MKNGIVRAIPKYNGKIVETCNIYYIYTQINDR